MSTEVKPVTTNEVVKLILGSIRTGSREDWEERIHKLLDNFGAETWKRAQKDASDFNAKRIDEQRKLRQPVSVPFATYTPYKK
jgi:hypothetical protein